MTKYEVIIYWSADDGAFLAEVPDLPGCIRTGKTLEDTERNIREAIEGHLQTLREFGPPIPEPASLVKEVEVSPAA